MKFLVTGANGFIGRTLCAELCRRGHVVRAAVRAADSLLFKSIEVAAIGPINAATDWMATLCGLDVVIHLAARVHVMRDYQSDPLEEFRKVNAAGTEHLARCAAAAGVKRLVYVSSVKVNGESSPSQDVGPLEIKDVMCFTEADAPSPQDPYSVSKWEAELALHRVALEAGLEVVIVRPPLVYGSGVKGNFAHMIRVLKKNIPLPLASVRNLRSLVYVGNLVDALILCATHPAAADQTYLVSDGEDVATPDLLRWLGEAMGSPARLFPCPSDLLKRAGHFVGKSEQIERLTGSLRVDSSKIRQELGWRPPFTLREGLKLSVSPPMNCYIS